MKGCFESVAVVGLVAALSVASVTSTATKEPRFPVLTLDQLNDKQRPLAERLLRVSSVGLAGPYNPAIRSPGFLEAYMNMGRYLRFDTSVPLKLNEFAILIVARKWRSQVEWFAHAPLAIKAGLSPQIVAELKSKQRPSNMAADEAMVFDLVTELESKLALSDETFARARAIFSDQQLVDLVAVIGLYEMTAFLLALGDESVPADKEPPFKPGEP